MPEYESEIDSVIGIAPSDLIAYYAGRQFPVYPRSRINCLSFVEAKDYSHKIQQIPVAEQLGLWVLDDANDSNPYAYISKGPCAGMIMHFSHDPEPCIAFSSLGHFLTAMNEAGERGLDIDDVRPEQISILLEATICALAAQPGTDDRTFFLTTYLPLCADLRGEIKATLARDEDFFVREALATFMEQRPRVEDLAIAVELAKDRYPQVARRAIAAVAAIRKINSAT